MSDETLFFELALEDVTQAAELFRPIFEATEGSDGWVSLGSFAIARARRQQAPSARRLRLHAQAACSNLLIKIPGTPEGIVAIEQSIFAGIPVNVTLLFSCDHYLAAAHAYMRGLERRAALGLDLKVGCVASLFVSRWDVAADKVISGSVSQPTRHRDRDARLQGLSRAAAIRPLEEARGCGCSPAAPTLGQHGHQGSGGTRHAVCRGPRPPTAQSTRSRKRRCWLSRTTGR